VEKDSSIPRCPKKSEKKLSKCNAFRKLERRNRHVKRADINSANSLLVGGENVGLTKSQRKPVNV